MCTWAMIPLLVRTGETAMDEASSLTEFARLNVSMINREPLLADRGRQAYVGTSTGEDFAGYEEEKLLQYPRIHSIRRSSTLSLLPRRPKRRSSVLTVSRFTYSSASHQYYRMDHHARSHTVHQVMVLATPYPSLSLHRSHSPRRHQQACQGAYLLRTSQFGRELTPCDACIL